MNNVQKAIAITDARISFVSLVDKAANKRSFLITKATDGKAQFSTYGRIIKADAEHHFITGIVYEPNTEDAHGNFMTEEEILFLLKALQFDCFLLLFCYNTRLAKRP